MRGSPLSRRWWMLLLLIVLLPLVSPPAHPVVSRGAGEQLLALYVLAYDNKPGSAMDLTPHYATTLNSIALATVGHPEKLAVVLADLHGVGDTHIRVIANGTITTIIGLPDTSGVLSPTLHEYDVADGATLGGFLRWARPQFPAAKTTFSYIGHGAPLVPETDLAALLGPNPLHRAPQAALPPLPTKIGANPDLTDQHTPAGSPRPYSVLTPYAFAQALALGGGLNAPFAVVDVVMCFGASIEELTEIAPYANFITASPNYAFFDPTSPGINLTAINPLMTPRTLANTLIASYDALLPTTDHPRILVAADTSQILGVKQAWDQTAAALYALLLDPTQRAATRQKMLDAYTASLKYDLSYCPPPDFDLTSPDGLVDMRHFAVQIAQQFSANQAVSAPANLTASRLYTSSATPQVISARAARNGAPWFDPIPSMWVFDGSNPGSLDDDAAGISMYADFMGQPISSTLTELSWHAHWYHDDATAADNPHPFLFSNDGAPGVGWDEVFQEFWRGTTTRTALCIPTIPRARAKQAQGDLAVFVRPNLVQSTVALSQAVQLSAVVTTTQLAASPTLRFRVTQGGAVVFEATTTSDYLVTGTHRIVASTPWIPASLGAWQLDVVVDATDVIAEFDETNNRATWNGTVVTSVPERPVLAAKVGQNRQFIQSSIVPLTLNLQQTTLPPANRLVVQVYQFAASAEPHVYVPVLRGQQTFAGTISANLVFGLPATTQPGAVVLHIWAVSPVGRSLLPAVVAFNYAPPNAELRADAAHIYRFNAIRQQNVKLDINLMNTGGTTMFAWEPFVIGTPNARTLAGNSAIIFNPVPLSGEYVLLVQTENNLAFYTLSVSSNGVPFATKRLAPDGTSPLPVRPRFIEPLAELAQFSVFVPLVLR